MNQETMKKRERGQNEQIARDRKEMFVLGAVDSSAHIDGVPFLYNASPAEASTVRR